jgi:hypothetical protein
MRRDVGGPVYGFYLPDEDLREETEQRARAALGPADFQAASARGEAMDVEAVAAYAMASGAGMPPVGGVTRRAGDDASSAPPATLPSQGSTTDGQVTAT